MTVSYKRIEVRSGDYNNFLGTTSNAGSEGISSRGQTSKAEVRTISVQSGGQSPQVSRLESANRRLKGESLRGEVVTSSSDKGVSKR